MNEYEDLLKESIEGNKNPLEVVLEFYTNKYKVPKELKYEIAIVDDIEKSAEEYFKKIEKEYDYISDIDYNGVTLVPHTTDEPIMILLSKDRAISAKDNNCEIICTLFHELTHVVDFYNYYSVFCDGNYDSGIGRDSQYGFHNWSEFHAKKISYLEYGKIIYKENYNSSEVLDIIVNKTLPIKNDELDNYLTNDYDLEEIIYNLMFYLGRYSVWEDWFPDEFKNGNHFSKELKKYQPLVDTLFDLLKNTNNTKNEYENIKKHINFFKGMYVNLNN